MNNFVQQAKNYSWTKVLRPSDMQCDDYESIDFLLNKVIKQNIKILEIGSNQGGSCVLFGLYAKEYNGQVISIDNYDRDCFGKKGDYTPVLRAFQYNIQQFKIENFVKQIKLTSLEANSLFKDEEFDFIFIDGSHLYPDIKEDLDIWFPKVKKGGIFCGHDCEMLLKDSNDIYNYLPDYQLNSTDYIKDIHPGVVKAVSEKFINAKIQGYRIWWVKNNGVI